MCQSNVSAEQDSQTTKASINQMYLVSKTVTHGQSSVLAREQHV